MLKQLKQGLLYAARGTGALDVMRESRWRRRRLLILGYHGVSLDDEHEWNPPLYLSPETFAARMRALRRGGYNVLPLQEALARLRADELPPKAVAITFDDGTHDFHERALPILRESGFPVTLYLTTYYTERASPVFDVMCSYLLWKGRDRRLDVTGILGLAGHIEAGDDTRRQSIFRHIRSTARAARVPDDEKDAILRRIAGIAGVDYDALLERRVLHLMTPGEVARVAQQGVDVQLHTHRHRSPSDRALFLRELADNAAAIRAMVPSSGPLTHFCYPSGIWREELLPWLREQGVQSATTCVPGLASPDDEPLLLPRLVDTSFLSNVEFEGWLSGASSLLPRRDVAPES